MRTRNHIGTNRSQQMTKWFLTRIPTRIPVLAMTVVAFSLGSTAPARAADKLLQETVEFTGTVFYLKSKVPGLIIGAVRNGEVAIAGFGRVRDGSKTVPNGDTLIRIGSITKAFTGQVLASMVADGSAKFTDTLQSRLGWQAKVPSRGGGVIRLIELATHTSGLPREIDRPNAPPTDPFATITKANMIKNLKPDALLFAPGRGALYSNFAFDLLAQALSTAGKKPYETLLREHVLTPIGMTSTGFAPTDAQRKNLFQGHGFDGKPLPDVPTPTLIQGSGGLYSTPKDILRWMAWHLDRRGGGKGAETRLLSHAAYVQRDGLKPVYGLDESGRMDAMGLGWIVMMPKGDRPMILQKAGGLQGVFSYVAFAPTRGIAVFISISEFDFGAAMEMATVVNELIANLEPR